MRLQGASCVFLGTNTMHRVRDEIKKAISAPFIDIFETVPDEIKKQNKFSIGLLGTYPVMSDKFYYDSYKKNGVNIITPEEEQKIEIDLIIFEKLTFNEIKERSKKYLIKVIRQLINKGAEGVISGYTEINLLLNQTDIPEVLLFDTLELHCEKAARICIGEDLTD